MSIPFSARFVDLLNLVISKGTNFALTATLFALLAQDMSAGDFAEFGYWWSVALMIGGMALGGVSSALVRQAALRGSLRGLLPRQWPGIVAAAVALAAVGLVAVSTFKNQGLAWQLAAAALFGLALQAQTAVLTLLRAAEATRANVLASLLILLVVPAGVLLLVQASRAPLAVFAALSAAYLLGAAGAYMIGHQALVPLMRAEPRPHTSRFGSHVAAFTAVNVFSYVAVNIDFTLFRMIGEPDTFALMATAKVYFERFILPLLMVFGAAISLRVLRHPQGGEDPGARLTLRLTPFGLLAAGLVLVVIAIGYFAFAGGFRDDNARLAWPWVCCATLGYLLYVANGILLDVLVVRRSLAAVTTTILFFLIATVLVQWGAIKFGGVAGWAAGWLGLNLCMFAAMVRECAVLARPASRPQ